jgi:16S rRNA (cytosine1402-N4)-methyltransferase
VDGTLGAEDTPGVFSKPANQTVNYWAWMLTAGLEVARRNLRSFGRRAVLVQDSYTNLSTELDTLGWETVDRILLDLGLSSMQLVALNAVFFQVDAPLDMRFDPRAEVTADDLVNRMPEQDSQILSISMERSADPAR